MPARSAPGSSRSRLNPALKVTGFLPTLFDGRSRHALSVMEHVALQAHLWGVQAFKPIPKSIRFAEAPAAGQTVLTTATRSAGAAAYREHAEQLAKSVVRPVDDAA